MFKLIAASIDTGPFYLLVNWLRLLDVPGAGSDSAASVIEAQQKISRLVDALHDLDVASLIR